jgi:EthD domain-containing protein
MVKAVSFFKRTPGMSVEDFQGYWRARHPGVVTRLPGIVRYVQSHTLISGYRKGERSRWEAAPESRTRGVPRAAPEPYSEYGERAAEGANDADGPFSAAC